MGQGKPKGHDIGRSAHVNIKLHFHHIIIHVWIMKNMELHCHNYFNQSMTEVFVFMNFTFFKWTGF